MKKFFKYIVAWFLCFAMLFSVISGSYAAGDLAPTDSQDVSLDDAASFWQWIQGDSGVGFTAYWDALWSFDSEGCTASPDGMHFWNCSDPTVGLISNSFIVECSYCGLNYREYLGKEAGPLTNEDLDTAYNSYVEEFPATGFNSAGKLIWQPSGSDLANGCLNSFGIEYKLPHSETFEKSTLDLSLSSGGNGFVYESTTLGSYNFPKAEFCYTPRFVAPISGVYTVLPGPASNGIIHFSNGTQENYSSSYLNRLSYHCNSGAILELEEQKCLEFESGSVYRYANVLFPVFEVVPTIAVDTGEGGQYNVSTRPTSITGGNYGIVGDDGTINTVTTNNQIINETNNTYYNPATGETSTIADWSYNYEDRSYTLTLENGDTSTVTYGDENISITENNNNYTIYYMVDKPTEPAPSPSPSQDPSPSPSACVHNWEETSRTEPDCISSGSATYTCSKCGETKTETLKVKGHDWKVERTVQTTYDEAGNLIQQGYTIYKCSVCGEQYKDDQGTGPPGSTAPDDVSGISAIVTAIFDELPKLFRRFLDFLGVVFPFLPPEITLLLTFGVVAVVFIGIIKAIRR